MSPRRSRGSKASRPALKARWGAQGSVVDPPQPAWQGPEELEETEVV
jgi:hypothetical protein